jgi:hypothetical protein
MTTAPSASKAAISVLIVVTPRRGCRGMTPPAGSINNFFLMACEYDYKQIHGLIADYVKDDDLARKLAAARANDEKDIGQGARTDLEHRGVTTKLTRNDAAYLLRRLARDHPDIAEQLARCEVQSM